MSSRFYPRYVKGNPQLRVFLPDWKIVLVKPKTEMPENVVTFKTNVKMTDWDIKNYLEKIYKVKIAGINSKVVAGDLRRSSKGLSKHDDYRLAHVSLPTGQSFKWPNLFPKEKMNEEVEDYKKTLNELAKGRKIDPNRTGTPGWFA